MDEAIENGMRCPTCGGQLSLYATTSSIGQKAPTVEPGQTSPARPLSYTPEQAVGVGELAIPAHNEVDAQAIRQWFSSIPLPISLEYYGSGSRRTMLVRAPLGQLKFISGKISATWPAAQLNILSADPLNAPVEAGVSRYDLAFALSKQEYLPLRAWKTFLEGDPAHGMLAATLGLRPNERAWIQVLVSRKGEPDWLPEVQRRVKTESLKGFQTTTEGAMLMGTTVMAAPVEHVNFKGGAFYVITMLALGLCALLGWLVSWVWFLGIPIALGLLYLLRKLPMFSRDDEWYSADIRQISSKIVEQEGFFRTMVRASVWTDGETRARMLMDQIQAALNQYDVSGGNSLTSVNAYPDSRYWPTGTNDTNEDYWAWLTASEVSALWHPPIVNEVISPGLIPVRGVESRAPDPEDVTGYYEIGSFIRPDASKEPVSISAEAIRKNTFLIGKTGTGKSTMQEHLVLAACDDPEQPAVVVIDPHGDMFSHLLGAIPARHQDRVRLLDVGDPEYVLSYNPLDVKSSGLTPDQSAQLIVDIGRSLWADFWGPRMQNPLKRAVQALSAANDGRPQGQALGLSLLSSVLSTNPEVRKRFLDMELNGHPLYPLLSRYFYGDYKQLSNNMREQIIQPVLSKAYRFEEDPMLALFSTGGSSLNPGEIIQKRQILLVNTRMSRFGSELSDFVGSMLINVLIREISRQGEISTDHRAPVTLVIDEFQTFTGAPWQEVVAQMRKWGGRTILGTQSLASMKTNSPDLVGVIMSGMYNMFAYQMNGEDARYISENELSAKDGGPAASTLTNLEPYFAYARLVRPDGKLTRPFYFVAREPAKVDEAQAKIVWDKRATYSRSLVDATREAAAQATYLDDQYGGVLLSNGAQPVNPGRRGRTTPTSGSGPSQLSEDILRKAAAGKEQPVPGSADAVWFQLSALGDHGLGGETSFDGAPEFPEELGEDEGEASTDSKEGTEAPKEKDDGNTIQATINAMQEKPMMPETSEISPEHDPLSDFLAEQFDGAIPPDDDDSSDDDK
jgi:Type IV secretory pathway, VirD4 components